MEGIKRIFLEYSSLPLFGSFNRGNGRSILLFGSLSGRMEWLRGNAHSSIFPQNHNTQQHQ